MNIDAPVTTTRDPWLPLPPKGGKGGTNETQSNYRFFQVYLHESLVDGRRSLQRTADIVGRSLTRIEDLSSRCHWGVRVASWDRRVAEIAVEERLRQVREKAERWAKRTEDSLDLKYEVFQETVAKGRDCMKVPTVDRTIEQKDGSKVTYRLSAAVKVAERLLARGFQLRDEAVAEAKPARTQAQEINENEYEIVPIAAADPDSQTEDSAPDPTKPGALP
jgi:hypothetical protein